MTKTFVNFTAEQVLAALNGEVVVVREAVKGFPSIMSSKDILPELRDIYLDIAKNQCPYGPIGNTIWVREAMQRTLGENLCCYGADNDAVLINKKWASWEWEKPRRSPSQMPRWASRLNVTVKSVTIEQGDDSGWEWVVEMIQEKNNETRK